MLTHPRAGKQRRYQVDVLLLHLQQRIVLEKAAVFYRIDSRGDGHFRGTVAVAVGSHFAPPIVCFGDDGVHFFLSQLRIVHGIGQR